MKRRVALSFVPFFLCGFLFVADIVTAQTIAYQSCLEPFETWPTMLRRDWSIRGGLLFFPANHSSWPTIKWGA